MAFGFPVSAAPFVPGQLEARMFASTICEKKRLVGEAAPAGRMGGPDDHRGVYG
jgi:hypothetical protein